MDLGLSGLASNLDWRSLIDKLADVQRLPEKRLLASQNTLNQRLLAYQSIQTQLGVVQNKADDLKDPNLFNARTALSSDSTIATVTAAAKSPIGRFSLLVSQLATAAVQQGTANAGAALNNSNDVSTLALSNAAFANPVTAGTFTVNGATITIATSDTLQSVFDQINSATSGQVTASYNSTNDQITLSSASTIVLGSAADTSNFLQAAKLSNANSATVVSSDRLGAVKIASALNSSNLSTPITDGGSGLGKFKINGVEISFSASGDSVQNVLDRINSSPAGVTASYDSINDRFLLTNKSTGDLGVALADVTGNFLAATGLSSGSLSRGNDLLYSINSGGQLSSHSNTITDQSSGLTGLTLTALKQGTATIDIANDTSKIKSAISSFITEYNKAQSIIDTQTASSTDASGKVTAGILAGESEAHEMASKLRNLAFATVSGLSGSVDHISDLGIDTNGNDNSLAITDSAKLDSALSNNLSAVQDFFTNSTSGLAVQLHSYLNSTIGDGGSLITKENNLTKQSTGIDSQISDLERVVQSNRQTLFNSFVAMETAQAKIQQQMQFLNQRFPTS